MRLFAAVDLPDDARAEIGARCDRLRAALRHAGMDGVLRWVPPANLHLTLRFLGNVDADAAPRVIDAMRAPIDVPRESIDLAGLGTFPPRGRPRVLHVAVTRGAGFLSALRDAVDARLAPLCAWEPETRPFTPHLTLARGRERAKFYPVEFSRLIDEAAWSALHVDVAHVTLFSSRTLPAGPEYTIQAQAACAG